MADKKLNEVTKVTDMAYVPVIMSDGSIGQIAKADLASVVAGLLRDNSLYPFMRRGQLNSISEADNISSNGWWNVTGSSASVPLNDWGTLIVYSNGLCQTFRPSNCRDVILIRTKLSSGWGDWYKITGSRLS